MSVVDSELVEELGARAAEACRQIDAIGGRPALSRRLRDAAHKKRDDTDRQYSVVVLCGPTGGGKSTLFNALLGAPDASQESADQRCCTSQLIIACNTDSEAFCRNRWPEAKIVGHRLPTAGLVLIDCPDVNGPHDAHRDLATKALDAADVAIWVMSGLSTPNCDSWRWLQDHVAGRRWWMVGTLRDEDEDPRGVRASVVTNARRIGIEGIADQVYAFDSKRPNQDFMRFREVVMKADHARRVAIAGYELKLDALESAFTEADEEWFRDVAGQFKGIQQSLLPQTERKYAELFWSGDGPQARGIGPSLVRQLAGELHRRIWLEAAERTLPPISYVAMLRARVQGALVAWNLYRGVTNGFGVVRLLNLTRAWLASRWVEVAVERVALRYDGQLREVDESVRRMVANAIRQHGLKLSPEEAATPVDQAESLIHDLASDLPVVGRKWAERIASSKASGVAARAVASHLSQALDGELDRQAEAQGGRPWWPISLLGCLALVPLAWAGVILVETAYRREWLPTAFYLQAAALMLLAMLPASMWLFVAINRVRCDEQVERFLRNPSCEWLPASQGAGSLAKRIENESSYLTALRDDAKRLRLDLDSEAGESAGYSLRLRSTRL